MYYCAMCSNLVLRVTWVLTISPSLTFALPSDYATSIVYTLEVLRRQQWNVLRLESKHVHEHAQCRHLSKAPAASSNASETELSERSASAASCSEATVSPPGTASCVSVAPPLPKRLSPSEVHFRLRGCVEQSDAARSAPVSGSAVTDEAIDFGCAPTAEADQLSEIVLVTPGEEHS